MKNYPNRISIKTLLMAVTFCVTIPQILKANDADSIKELYKSRQFKKAIQLARKDRTTNLAENEKAEILKFTGMSHYAIGNRSKATNYFESALKHNPSLVVQTNETVNPSLVVFLKK